MDAHRLRRYGQAGFAREEFCHACFEVYALAEVFLLRGVHDEQMRRFHLRGHVGQFLLYRLMFGYGFAERLARLGVPDGGLQRGAGYSNGASGDVDAAELQPAHDVPKAVAFGSSEEIRDGYAVVIERQFSGLDATITEFGDVPHDIESGALLAQQDTDAAMRRVGGEVGLADDGVDAAVTAVGDEHLAAIDDVIVAVTDSPGLDGGNVCSGVGFGDAEGCAFRAVSHGGEETLLLLLGAGLLDHVGDEQMGVQHAGEAHPAFGQLLDEEGVRFRACAASAVLLRNGRTEEAEFPHLSDEVGGVFVREFQSAGDWKHLPVDEVPDGGDEGELVFG